MIGLSIVQLTFIFRKLLSCYYFPIVLKIWKVKVAQSCLTLCDPMDHVVHGILQARILEWVADPFSRGSSQPRDWTQVSCIAGGFFTSWTTREALKNLNPKWLVQILIRERIFFFFLNIRLSGWGLKGRTIQIVINEDSINLSLFLWGRREGIVGNVGHPIGGSILYFCLVSCSWAVSATNTVHISPPLPSSLPHRHKNNLLLS